MGTLRSPKSWMPYMNSTDCSQGFCSYYCPQWCYITFPPPPPFRLPNESSGLHFSPLIIAILGIFASGFLLVSYYTLLSKYCGNTEPSTREGVQQNSEIEGSRNSSSILESWHNSSAGLDEALIKSITVCKFKKGDGLVEGTCSVCLNDFEEDENIRLLPICTHPFHIPCIDTWLISHSNCPLCRSSIVPTHASSIEVLPSVARSIPPRREALTGIHHAEECVSAAEHIERGSPEEESPGDNLPSTTLCASSNLGSLQRRDTIIDIEDNRCPRIRKSVSMDYSFETRLSIHDILQLNQDDEIKAVNCQLPGSSGSLEQPVEGKQKLSHKKSSVHHIISPIAMKRSFSSGKFLETRQGRLESAIIFL